MDYSKKAQEVLDETELRLRDLIADAAANSRYDELPALAQIAGAIARLRSTENWLLPVADSDPHVPTRPQADDVATEQNTESLSPFVAVTSNTFPRFEIDGSRLVKLGWSPRDKRVYEHRVEREVVNGICERLIQKTTARKPFKMEKLFPMHTADDAEIPSYKAYLVLKWLQHFKIIERKGKDGYIFLDRNFAPDVVNDLWKRTSQRSGIEG